MRQVNRASCLFFSLIIALQAVLAVAQVRTTNPSSRDSDDDHFWDGPDILIEIDSKRYVRYGEDKNGNGKYEPEGLDGKLGTADDEFDPNNPSSHPDGPLMEKAPEGLPIIKPESPPIPTPSEFHYYFFVTLDHDQVVEAQERHSYARGLARLEMNTQTKIITYALGFCGLEIGEEKEARIMGPAPRGEITTDAPLCQLPIGLEKSGQWRYAEGKTPSEITEIEQNLKSGLLYIDIVTAGYPDGELRGQIDIDRDCDGLTDYRETQDYHTNPLDRDSDDDGLYDGEEVDGLGRMQIFEVSGWVNYLKDKEDVARGTSDNQPTDLPPPDNVKSGTISDPNNWDSDTDGLADGLELGVTASIAGFVQDGVVIQGTQFSDTNGDGLQDTLGYRLVDLAPNEPNTNPLSDDSNGNGHMDGEDDANRNGRIDPGEKDPVMGFQSDAESDTGGAVDGILALGFQADTPYGNCYYLRFFSKLVEVHQGRKVQDIGESLG